MIRRILSEFKAKLFGTKYKVLHEKFMGHDLRLYERTIRNADKDDAWFYELVKRSNCFFDIGANVGSTGIYAKSNNRNKKVLLVDPNLEALTIAYKNLMMNEMGLNSQFFCGFVSDKVGEQVKFYTIGIGEAGSMFRSHAHTASKTNSFFYINTVTIDHIVETIQWIPDLIKVDVEGAETFVLNGSMSLASQQKTSFFIEMHRTEEIPMVQNAQMVLDWCKKTSYNCYYLKNHALLSSADEVANRGKCHFSVMPSSMAYPEFLKDINEGDSLKLSTK
ncbi:MAG: FkbM family methyltransferase [Bacteroidota bacterium]|nr:FkbM family methyltransferase [Bacteroidota bacterium]